MTTDEEIELLKTRLERDTDERGQAETLMEILRKYGSRNSTDAQPCIDMLLQKAENLNEPLYLAWGIYYQAFMKRFKADYEDAITLSLRAVSLFEPLGEKNGMALAFSNIGNSFNNQGDYPEALKNHFASLKISEETGNKEGLATSYNNIGNVYRNQGNYSEARRNHFSSLRILREIGNSHRIGVSYINIGNTYSEQGNYPEALKNYFAALRIMEEEGDNERIALSYNNIGIIYHYQGNYQEALKNHFISLKIKEEIGDKIGIAHSYHSIGNIYNDQEEYLEALKNHLVSLKIMEETGNKPGMANSYESIGMIYQKQGKHPEALSYLFNGLTLSIEIGEKPGIAWSYYGIGSIYKDLGNVEKSLQYLSDAFKISEEIGDLELTKKTSLSLSQDYTSQGDFKNALVYYKKYHNMERETLGEESQKQINNLQFMHNLEQKEKEAAFEKLKREEEEHLRTVVEQKNAELIQSINYALKIQTAILPTPQKVKNLFPSSFVLYMPKDIVSGDFYWMESVLTPGPSPKERGAAISPLSFGEGQEVRTEVILFAACDCTGHGVPGAMVSLVCHNALNRAVHEYAITQPSLILDKVCELVVESFKTTDEGVKDGMDISLCAFDPENMTLQWSGANNPLWLLRENEIMELKADKQPIGASDYGRKFTNHSIDLRAGDIIYLFTDGYADQFGGADGKKLTRKRMRHLLLDMQHIGVSGQGDKLGNFILDFKKDTFQIDDILVMGVQI